MLSLPRGLSLVSCEVESGCPHFTDVDTEAREVKSVAQDQSASGRQPVFIPTPTGSLLLLGGRKPPLHYGQSSYR